MVELADKVSFEEKDGVKTFRVGSIAVRDFGNKIWRSGFVYGVMTGGGLILLVFGFVVSLRFFI